MSQTSLILDTLKIEMRRRGKTYLDAAEALNLSEASVKRLFSEEAYSLKRIDRLCELIGLQLHELVELSQQSVKKLEQLDLEQEQKIANDIVLLMITVSVMNGFSFTDLSNYYAIPEHECIQKLIILDKLNIIELLPENKFRLLISPNFRWRINGPIQHFFHTKVQEDFFSSRFESKREKLLVLNGLFSEASNTKLQDKMDALLQEFNHLISQDRRVPLDEKRGTTMVIALREWQYGLFSRFIRDKS